MATANDSTRPSVVAFNKEQRARLEALTFARELTHRGYQYPPGIDEWLRLAKYIVRGGDV